MENDGKPRRFHFAVCALLAVLSQGNLIAGVGEWTTGGPDGGAVLDLAAHPANPSTVYLATEGRLYKSVNSGLRWTPTGLSASEFILAVPTSSPSVVYAWLPGDATFLRSADGGASWVSRPGPT
ncbi:MAG TPA: hypothetical protein VKG01_09330, partial [Thermoanaerobaculia bacterium]|nr:hypothetical protein [Thermoanaerobaculia bacterium]